LAWLNGGYRAIGVVVGTSSFLVIVGTVVLWLLDTRYVSRAEYEELEQENQYLMCASRFDRCTCEVILPPGERTCG
jgi:hypothetical protein